MPDVTTAKYAPITEEDEWYSGTHALFEFEIANAGDITSWTLEFVVKYSERESTRLIVKNIANGGLVITDGPNRKFRVTIDDGDTAQIKAPVSLFYWIWRTDDALEQVTHKGPALLQRGPTP